MRISRQDAPSGKTRRSLASRLKVARLRRMAWPQHGWITEPSVRIRLIILVFSVIVPAALALVLGALLSWNSGRSATEQTLIFRAQTVAAMVERELDLARVTLQVLATSPSLAQGDLQGFRQQVERTPHPSGTSIVLSDQAGQRLVHSQLPAPAAPPQQAGQAAAGRVLRIGRPRISDLYVDPVSSAPGIVLDMPVHDQAGPVPYVLSIALHSAHISALLERHPLPPAWTSAVLDRKKILVARSRNAAQFVGQPAAPSSTAAITAGQNPFRTVTQEGAAVRGAYAPIGSSGWTAVVVVPQSELDAPLRSSLMLAILVSGALLLLGLAVAIRHANRIGRSLLALARGALALGRQGEPPPVPAGVREATCAGVALRRAARNLRHQREERDLAEHRRSVVVAELNHRVKNVLATIQALVAQTQRGTQGDPQRFMATFNDRLKALARAHDLLTTHAWEDMALEQVVRGALEPWFGGAPDLESAPISLRFWGAGRMGLRPQQAQSLVLALHELATNAAKHGALSQPGGRVTLSCTPEENAMARLDWTESGGPPIPAPPRDQGFGTRLLERGLARDLGSGSHVTLHFEPEGLRVEMRFRVTLLAPRRPHGPGAT